MEIITETELQLRKEEFLKKIANGAIFIHPTDTIYGLGCNALNKKAVEKLREIKERKTEPLSVWVPSPYWIKENCLIEKKTEEWLSKLPGPYTLILPLKNKNSISENVAPNLNALGVRYPKHWFGKIIGFLGVPIVTTSANKAGSPFMTNKNDLDPEISSGVSFMIYEGEKKARPSKIINLVNDEVKER
jgi:L-threonylcarbamoyladenylate synthase